MFKVLVTVYDGYVSCDINRDGSDNGVDVDDGSDGDGVMMSMLMVLT